MIKGLLVLETKVGALGGTWQLREKIRRKDEEDFRTCLLDRLVSGENTVGTTAAPVIQDNPEDDSESEAKEISGQWATLTVHSGGDRGAFALRLPPSHFGVPRILQLI